MNTYLAQLELAVKNETYIHVLETIGKGIDRAEVRIGNAASSKLLESEVVDDNCDLVEDLLGEAFVVCQTQINTIASRALSIYRCDTKIVATKKQLKKSCIYSFGGQDLAPEGISHIAGIASLANYFKHRGDWHSSIWTNPVYPNNYTIDDIRKIGLKPHNSGNLRTGSRWLGNVEYKNTTVFCGIVNTWSKGILSECTSIVKTR